MLESFFNKVAGFRPATSLKRRVWDRCFPVNFAKFLRTPYFAEHLRLAPSEPHLANHHQDVSEGISTSILLSVCMITLS